VKRCATLFSCLFVLASSCARHAHAAAACAGDKPWVAVSGDVPARFAEAVRSDLRAGLSPSSIDVCAAAAQNGAEPLARVSIEQVGLGSARYSLEVTDSVTHKRVGRDLSLEKLPADGRAFALAVAAEELLRASWAELALRGVHSPQTAAPPEVRAIVENAERRPRAPSRFLALGARLAFERFLGGQTHYGADLFGVAPLGEVAAGLFAVGARRALSESAPHGSIGGSALSAELGLSLMFLRRGGLDLGAFVSERLLRVSFEPEASVGSAASARSGLALTSRVGLGLAFGSPGLLRSYTALGAGLPLKSFSASDGGQTVTGASKLELFASTGLALELP
jgi:hypothetical protein